MALWKQDKIQSRFWHMLEAQINDLKWPYYRELAWLRQTTMQQLLLICIFVYKNYQCLAGKPQIWMRSPESSYFFPTESSSKYFCKRLSIRISQVPKRHMTGEERISSSDICLTCLLPYSRWNILNCPAKEAWNIWTFWSSHFQTNLPKPLLEPLIIPSSLGPRFLALFL